MSLKENGYEQANNVASLSSCVDGMKTVLAVYDKAFSGDASVVHNWSEEKSRVSEQIDRIEMSLHDRPFVSNDTDIKTFISFVRTQSFSSVAIKVDELAAYTGELTIRSSDLDVSPPAGWLTDG